VNAGESKNERAGVSDFVTRAILVAGYAFSCTLLATYQFIFEKNKLGGRKDEDWAAYSGSCDDRSWRSVRERPEFCRTHAVWNGFFRTASRAAAGTSGGCYFPVVAGCEENDRYSVSASVNSFTSF
jgi:hypothetical protein